MAQQVKPVNSRELIAQALGIKLFSGFEDPEQLIPDLDSSLNIALDKISSLQNVIAVLFSLCPGSTDTIIRTPLCDVPVHCAILNIWTPQFKTMLESGMAESRSKVIEINHESPCYVKQMVDFMYTAGTLMDNKNVFPLLRLACCYEIVALRDQCIDYLLDNISLENCVQLFDISVQHEDENVPKWKTMKEIALKFVKRNRMEILLSPTPFDSITPASIKELIAAWDKKEDMFSRTHAVLLGKAIKVWCNLQWQVSSFPSIIEHLDNMKHAGSTQFFVKLDSRSIPVCTSHGKTVYNLKCYIEDIEGIPVEYQKLQFNSTVLTNDLDLANCGITQDCTVYLKIRQANKKKDHNNKYKVDYGPFNIVYQLCIQALIRGFETEHVDLMKLDHYAITEIFASKYLNVSSELEVASFLETWLNYSPNRKKAIIVNRVVALLRLEHIPTRNLLSMRESHPSIASSSDFSYRVKSALKHQVNPEFRANVTPKRKHYVDEQSNSDTIVSFLFEKFNEPKKSREHE